MGQRVEGGRGRMLESRSTDPKTEEGGAEEYLRFGFS
jgi:hypothetical protein